MRDHSQHIQVHRDEAISAILSLCHFAPEIETIPLDQAFGRVLAEDATAQLDMPNSLTCAMDSIAVRWADFEQGMPDTSTWQRGVEWEFANTGVGMPEGFDTAIVVEHAQISDDDMHVSFDALPSKQGAGTLAAGSRMKAGDVLASAGTVISPLLAAHIASGGNTHVAVFVRPKIGFIPTGSELVPPASDIPQGKNIESNSMLMRGKIVAWGAEPVIYPICDDTPEAIEQAVQKAAAECDIVVLNAGSSKGSDDYSLEVLENMGKVLYHQVNHGPGHHCFCACIDDTPLVGISGPPGGVAFTTDFYLRPAIETYYGLDSEPIRVKARLASSWGQGGPSPAGSEEKRALKGEKRPRDPGSFFSVKQVSLRQGEDGVLEAYPSETNHPKPDVADTLDAYYLLESTAGARVPEQGEMIEVTLRPNRWNR